MNLTKSAIKGVKWTSLSQVVRQFSQYITTIILAAILNPSDFGIMAIALIVISFLEIFKDLGTSSAIIQRDDNTLEFLSSIFWANVFLGFIITFLLLIFSSSISSFFGDERVKDVLNILALTFAISGTGIIHKTLFEREIEFEKIFRIEIITSLVSSLIAIVLALWGYGVWSLVFQAVTNAVFGTILYWFFSKWRPLILINFSHIKTIFNYSINLLGYNVFNFAIRNLDYLLIGKFLGDQALGHYYIIYKIMLYPVQNISAVFSRVMFPIYSKIKNQENIFSNYYDKTAISIAIFSFPLMLGLMAISKPFTEVFFNRNWNSELLTTLIILLAPVGLIQSICSTTGPIFQVKGKTNWLFLWGVSSSIVVGASFLIGINWGVSGVAAGYLISTIILTYPCFKVPFKLLDKNVMTFLRGFNKIFISSFSMFVLVLSLYLILGPYVVPHYILVLQVIVGILTYIAIYYKMDKDNLLNMINYIKTGFSS